MKRRRRGKRLFLSLLLSVISTIAFCQTIFRPVKATITDSQGSFTSSNFNCPNMVVYDKGKILCIYFFCYLFHVEVIIQ